MVKQGKEINVCRQTVKRGNYVINDKIKRSLDLLMDGA